MRIFSVLLLSLFTLAACSNTPPLPEACGLKPESGKCRASIHRYYFDERSGVCKTFIWGGCDGVVPFETMENCQTQCRALAPPVPEMLPEPVKRPPEPLLQTPGDSPVLPPASMPAPAQQAPGKP